MFYSAEKVTSWHIGITQSALRTKRKHHICAKPLMLLSMPIFGRHAEAEKIWVRGQPQRLLQDSFRIRVHAQSGY